VADVTSYLDRPLFVVACSSAKADAPAPAHQLYEGSLYRINLQAALAEAEGDLSRVRILSARWGLVPAAQLLAPYDTSWGDDAAVTAAELACQLAELVHSSWAGHVELYLFGPQRYAAELLDAAELLGGDVTVHHVNEADQGVGFMRRTARSVRDFVASGDGS
jgi:hypothetical protein